MSAQPVQEHDQDDPVVILRVMPERFHEQSLSEYVAGAARRAAGSVPIEETVPDWSGRLNQR
jgi:hypothetical protein